MTLDHPIYLLGFQEHLWPHWNEASNSLKNSSILFWSCFFFVYMDKMHYFSIVFKFIFSNGLCMAWGPQKGILIGGFIWGPQKGQVVFQCRQNYNTKTEQKEPVWINLMFIKQIIWYVYFVGTVMCNGCLLVRQLPFLSDSAK